MRAVLSLCFLLSSLTLVFTQDLILTPIGETLCKPGVVNKSPGKGLSLGYGIYPNIRLRPGNATAISEPTKVGINEQFSVKLKAPILNKKTIKLLVGWNYYTEEYNFDNVEQANVSIFDNIDNQTLKSSRISIYMIKPINHKYYFAMKSVASFNGDYKGAIDFSKRYTRYDVAMIFGVKKKKDVEWGVGLLARKNFTNSFPLVPFAIYNHTFNSKWGLETTIPTSIMGRYNISDKNMMLFGPQFDSRTYSIDVQDNTLNDEANYTMRRSELRLTVRYLHNIKSWLWLEVATGYAQNFTTRFELDENGIDARRVDFTPSNGPFFKFGLFLSPPASKYK